MTATPSNRKKGAAFQALAKTALELLLGRTLELEVPIAIGNPPKNHDFDFATADQLYVGESKAYTWTKTGGNPSGKIGLLLEAARYLQLLPLATRTFIVMKRNRHPRNGKPLADHFVRLNRHMLGDVAVLELDEETRQLRTVLGSLA